MCVHAHVHIFVHTFLFVKQKNVIFPLQCSNQFEKRTKVILAIYMPMQKSFKQITYSCCYSFIYVGGSVTYTAVASSGKVPLQFISSDLKDYF